MTSCTSYKNDWKQRKLRGFISLWRHIKLLFCGSKQYSVPQGGRGYFTLVWVGGCRPDLETLTLFMIKSSCLRFSGQISLIFVPNCTIFRPYLWQGRKTIPGRARPHIAWVWEYPPPPQDSVLQSWNVERPCMETNWTIWKFGWDFKVSLK